MKRWSLILSVCLVLSVLWCGYLTYTLFASPTSWINTGVQLGFSGIISAVLLGFRLSLNTKSKTGLLWAFGAATILLSLIQIFSIASILSLWDYTLAIFSMFIGSVLMHTLHRKIIYKILLVAPCLLVAILFLLKTEIGIAYIIGTILCVIAFLVSVLTLFTQKD